MSKKEKMTKALAIEIAVGVGVWLAMIAAKALGFLQRMKWITLVFGLCWIPAVIILLLFILAEAADIARQAREAAYRIKAALTLKSAMHGMTLNTLGPVYGVERFPGEPNRHYEQRILIVASRGKKIRRPEPESGPQPATGRALDKIAKRNGLQRGIGESDRDLQERIREAVMKRLNEKLEGGKA